MNKSRPIVIVFFVIVFGLPIAWYFFLQAFGENRFDLPVLGEWNTTCINDSSFVVLDANVAMDFVNERNRIIAKMKDLQKMNYHEYPLDSCGLPGSIYLVDNGRMIRGEFELNREEVDRLLAEIDIYLLNLDNGTDYSNQ
ncbi:hypothetical protein ACHKAR_03075 [Marinoscillum luteum]|uniref:DUF4174 domain-containing protein n=2 Tax=Marinoscillum luteum TaxID=861051 RepID=A0ABW7N4N4_9BACT